MGSKQCKHTKKIESLVKEAYDLIDNVESGLEEPSVEGGFVRSIIPFVSNYDMSELRDIVRRYRWRTYDARSKLSEAKSEANRCNCQEKIESLEKDNRNLNADLSKFQRTVIFIGRTGSGKSTLANVITGTNKFKESGRSTSETKNKKVGEFTAENGIKYRIVDTIGIDDTELSSQETLKILEETAQQSNYNLNQIFFVFNGRLTDAEIQAFRLLKERLFKYRHDIAKYVTLVRTCFADFESKEKCNEDIEESRKILLNHLINNCQENYQEHEQYQFERGLQEVFQSIEHPCHQS